jgi:hypothetical protein
MFAADEAETLFGQNAPKNIGGFGAPVFKLSSIDGRLAYISGGRGGVIIDHSFVIGAGFYNYSLNSVKADYIDQVTGKRPRLSLNYFGLEPEYIYEPTKLVHLSFVGLLGGGWTGFELMENFEADGNSYKPDYGRDWFWVAEPQINAEANLFKWMRVAAGAGYRFTFGADYSFAGSHFDDEKLSGLEGTITLKFGLF